MTTDTELHFYEPMDKAELDADAARTGSWDDPDRDPQIEFLRWRTGVIKDEVGIEIRFAKAQTYGYFVVEFDGYPDDRFLQNNAGIDEFLSGLVTGAYLARGEPPVHASST
jgi:hypothetical protein